MSSFSPLRYPGGKGTLAPYVRELLDLNGLAGGEYAEPFAGGAGVALDLLYSGYVSHIHINDLDPLIHAFWHAAIHETERFVERIQSVELSVETWLEAREKKRFPDLHDTFELGFAAFLMNRTNRSGILNGGLIGGLAQSGTWKLDCRFNRDELADRVQRLGFFRSCISLSKQDAAEFLVQKSAALGSRALFYIDPPYYVKGAYLYENHYSHHDHVALSKVIAEIRHPWLVTYDNAPQIRNIYRGMRQEQFDIGYSARNHGIGAEVMVFSPCLETPPRVYSSLKKRRELAA
jgi:DNA adenine methylase